MAPYILRGSVFKIEFRVLARLENLNPLRPLQDLSGFIKKTEFGFMIIIGKKSLNNKILDVTTLRFHEKNR